MQSLFPSWNICFWYHQSMVLNFKIEKLKDAEINLPCSHFSIFRAFCSITSSLVIIWTLRLSWRQTYWFILGSVKISDISRKVITVQVIDLHLQIVLFSPFQIISLTLLSEKLKGFCVNIKFNPFFIKRRLVWKRRGNWFFIC